MIVIYIFINELKERKTAHNENTQLHFNAVHDSIEALTHTSKLVFVILNESVNVRSRKKQK